MLTYNVTNCKNNYFWSLDSVKLMQHCLNNFGDTRVTLKIIKLNLVSNDYIAVFRIFINQSFNFRIL